MKSVNVLIGMSSEVIKEKDTRLESLKARLELSGVDDFKRDVKKDLKDMGKISIASGILGGIIGEMFFDGFVDGFLGGAIIGGCAASKAIEYKYDPQVQEKKIKEMASKISEKNRETYSDEEVMKEVERLNEIDFDLEF